MRTIDASSLGYQDLNVILRSIGPETEEVWIQGVNGQRYIAAGMSLHARLLIEGTAGNDLAAFADGVEAVVNGNAQDGVGNTMSGGRLVIKGHATDLLAHSMRGGAIFVREDVGCRAAVHMKSYGERCPLVVIGGKAGDFLGEYMAGGDLVVLGLGHRPNEVAGRYIGPGMHGGRIFLRGLVETWQLGHEVIMARPDTADMAFLNRVTGEFSTIMELALPAADADDYVVLIPKSARPYGALYA